jgi:two-component system, OmpR family, sensor histidine kinase KdpD
MTFRPRGGRTARDIALTIVEVVAAIGLATAVVALLQSVAPAAGLGVIYLLAVLAIAIRRGEIAALVTAVLSMLTLNYLFIPPRHQLAIAHSRDFAELAVLLIVAVVVGRLAALARHREAEAESRASEALAHEREATLLTDVASTILAGHSIAAQLERIGAGLAGALGAQHARLELGSVPTPQPDEISVRVRSRARPAWLYVSRETSWTPSDLERISEPLGRLLDVALERERVAEQAAETEAAKRADVARTAILHAISHDLRSPLTAITTAASALRDAGVTTEERTELLDAIEAEGVRLARLVGDLLDLSKIEAGAVAPQPDWCDLHDTIGSAVAQLRTEHPVEFRLPEDLPLVRADAAQLERVFSNLIENAIKHSPEDVPVTITAGVGSGRVTVRVIDRGRGIPAADRTRVFEPFFRGRRPTGSGSGLGLAICRGFVEANGGQITLQSARGPGASFAVSFPLVKQPEAVT